MIKLSRKIPNFVLVTASAWISRIVSASIQVFIIRLLTSYLGADEYAYFVLLTSLVGWYSLGSFGIGFSLQNFVSELRAKEQEYKVYIASAFVAATILLLVLVLLVFLIGPTIAPLFLKQFNFIDLDGKIRDFVLVGFLAVIFGITSIVYNLWYSLDKGYLSSIIPAIASLVSFIAVYILTHFSIDNKTFWILFVYLLPTACFPTAFFIKTIINSMCQGKWIDFLVLKTILKRALQFGLFGLMAAAVVQIDYLVMSQNISSSEIILYNVTTKIFSIIAFVYSAVLTALWPEFTKSVAKNEWTKISLSIKKIITIGIIFFVLSGIVLAFLMPYIVKVISPSIDIFIPVSFIAMLTVYHLIRIWTDTYSMALQSMSDLSALWKWTPVQIIVNFLLQYFLSTILGVYGIITGLIISYIVTLSWILPLRLSHHLKTKQIQRGN